ncbi:MAG: S-layer homology domain-containing protein [Bryobacterales bacterium]|nr:S-layer homology domain-containing protein [Bryobacterales bacterium]
MAAFIVRALFLSDSFVYNTNPYFTDVPASHPFFKFIQKMKELGITNGCTTTTYCPDYPMSNSAAAIFTSRAYGLKPCYPWTGTCQNPVNDAFAYANEAYFPQDTPPGALWYNFMQRVRDLGIIGRGCDDRSFCPGSILNRGAASYYVASGIPQEFSPGDKRQEYATVRRVSTPSNWEACEPSIVGGGGGKWLAIWNDIFSSTSPPSYSDFRVYSAAWDPSTQRWTAPVQVGTRRFVDPYVVWNPVLQRFDAALLDIDSRNVFHGWTATGSTWTIGATPAMGGGGWDYPSIAVDGRGYIAIGAGGFSGILLAGYYSVLSTNGGSSFTAEAEQVVSAASPGTSMVHTSRIVATNSGFHVFVPGTVPLSQAVSKVHRYQSADVTSQGSVVDLTWSFQETLMDFNPPKVSLGVNTACIPGVGTNCGDVYFGTPLDAAGDPVGNRWSVVFKILNWGVTNIVRCSSGNGCSLVRPSAYEQFLPTTAFSPDGDIWVSYHTIATPFPIANPASNVNVESVRFFGGSSSSAAGTITTGSAPVSWANMESSDRCSPAGNRCWAAGDYVKIAADSGGVVAMSHIQQTPNAQNALFTMFSREVSSSFYAPYFVEPDGATPVPQGKPFQRVLAAAQTKQWFDPLPTAPAKEYPNVSFSPNSIPLGRDARDRGPALPLDRFRTGSARHRWADFTRGIQP